jgi:hypothetical protein
MTIFKILSKLRFIVKLKFCGLRLEFKAKV